MTHLKRYFAKTQTKSQLIYVVLALFLGALGIHNFYAGRWGRGFIQLLITLSTGFAGAIISSLWAIINIFTIETDGEGHLFHMNLPAKYICGILGIFKYLGEIIFWSLFLFSLFTRNDFHSVPKMIQETSEKIVKPNETIYKTTTMIE